MATITLWIDVEEALIEAGIERRKWAEYVNDASMEKLQRGIKDKGRRRIEVEKKEED